MEYRQFGKLNFQVSAVGLGTWVSGGWLWGGADDDESRAAITASLENGINLIDTAPVYGFGRSETVVGETVRKLGIRDRVILATKCGLEWDEKKEQIRRNASSKRILKEFDDSRRRLQTDVIDIYQIHWPDESFPIEKSMETLLKLYDQGLVRAIGVSNFSVDQMRSCMRAAPLHSLQPPYNLYERGIEKDILPFCREQGIAVLAYGALCRGLLSGKFQKHVSFPRDDIRSFDPKFTEGRLSEYLGATQTISEIAASLKLTAAQLAIRWVAAKPGVTSALAGARNACQARDNAQAFQNTLSDEVIREIEEIVEKQIPEAVGPEFMAPPRSIP